MAEPGHLGEPGASIRDAAEGHATGQAPGRADATAPMEDTESIRTGTRSTAADATPMMRQYREWKRRYPEYLLLFRLGDFYEAFYEDAAVLARLLGITLTARQKGEGAIPMAGVPQQAVDGYIARLIRAGQKVAVCDQVESAPAKGRKLIRREVVRLVTPGTVTEPGLLDSAQNNFLAALVRAGGDLGVALVDITTADFWVGDGVESTPLIEAVALRRPAEVLIPPSLSRHDPVVLRLSEAGSTVTVGEAGPFGSRVAADRLREHFGVVAIEGLGLDADGVGTRAAGAALAYLASTQQAPLSHLTRIQRLAVDEHLVLDEAAIRNLEVVESIQERSQRGSLLWALDQTRTPMGGRLLRQWLLRPLRDPGQINRRLAAVEGLVGDPALVEAIRDELGGIGDLERLASRVALGLATPRELGALRATLRPLPRLRRRLTGMNDALLADTLGMLHEMGELSAQLEQALVESPPATTQEGGIIREAHSPALAELRQEVREAKAWIAGLETRERQRTGIPTLRVRYNRVFGYGIEVSRPHLRLVPGEYIRRQTLVGGERFVTPELKDHEAKVVGAEERTARLELELFDDLRRMAAGEVDRLLGTARAVAVLDVLASLARVARERGYARPTVDRSDVLDIQDGRHPVLEIRPDASAFVPNDLSLDGEEASFVVLTGPNMAGKSTFMRQVALIVVLAQAGSFVPARSTRVGVVDRIFTRIGAHDNLLRGQSTFLVEMTETAAILRHATPRSLVLLDEIGRGTSTFDGLAIAWAVTEHLHERHAGVKVLFATHYHELTRLASQLPRVRNMHVAVREWRDGIVFLHKVQSGGTDRSYGIQVARLAGLPDEVVARAKGLLRELEGQAPTPGRAPGRESGQLVLFPTVRHPVLEAIAGLDPDGMTPLEALTTLHDLHRRVREDR